MYAIFSTASGSHDFYPLMTYIYPSNKILLVKENVFIYFYMLGNMTLANENNR